MMVIAITISAIAAWYSVEGLTAIFAAAVMPVIIMGGALEAGKITATVWLHNNWARVSWLYKTYLIPAILFLMLLTSMGIFGFLSKAHSDQSLVSGDAMSKVAIYDEKIKTSKENIDANRRALKQMDEAVDQVMARSDSEKGADKAVAIRRGQAKERQRLQAEITSEQKAISQVSQDRAPIAAEFRKVEADVGPVKYIAALIYGDEASKNMLEAAVRWVIILIVIVFDPLALCLILASNKQLEWAREDHDTKLEPPSQSTAAAEEPVPDYDPDDGPLTEHELEQIRIIAANAAVDQLEPPEPVAEVIEPEVTPDPVQTAELDLQPISEDTSLNAVAQSTAEPLPVDVFNTPVRRGADYAVRYRGKVYNLDAFTKLHPDLSIQADNQTVNTVANQCGFGDAFPANPGKGDMFIRTDYLPEKLFKWNSTKWIEVDKNSTDSYTYNQAYIQHLIAKLEAGEYEIEDLNEAEQSQVEQQINDILKNKNV